MSKQQIEIDLGTPNEKQKLFLNDHHRHVLFGGARGGGKTWVVRVQAVLFAFTYPGIRQFIVRRTYPELYENHIKPMKQMLPVEAYKYNDSRKEIIFPNGSEILFRYLDSDKSLDHFQGLEMDVLYIDEATMITEEQFKALDACVRGVNGFPKRTYLTCNPGGVGMDYVRRLWIDREYKDNEKPEEYSFIQSLVTDNKALMESNPEYIRTLEALPPKKREAWLYGNWDIWEGQYFEEWRNDPAHYIDRKWTHVIEPFEITDEYKIYRAYDHGYSKPFSVQWYAVDRDGVAYLILELYGCTDQPDEGVKWTAKQIFTRIHEIETKHRWLKGRTIIGVADPAIWGTQTGESVAEIASKCGVYFTPGDNSRVPGWMQVHYRLAFDSNGYAMLYVFKNCKAFIRTMPLLQYDDYRPEDLDTNGEDHCADSCRYFCMSRPISPRLAAKPSTYKHTPQAMFLDIDEKDILPAPHYEGVRVIG